MQQEILATSTSHCFLLQCKGQDQAAWIWLALAASQDDAPLPASSVCSPAVRAARASQLWLLQEHCPIMQHCAN